MGIQTLGSCQDVIATILNKAFFEQSPPTDILQVSLYLTLGHIFWHLTLYQLYLTIIHHVTYLHVSSDFLYLSIWHFNRFFFDFHLWASVSVARRILDGHFETLWKPWPIECSMIIYGNHGPKMTHWMFDEFKKSWKINDGYIVCDKTGIHGYPEKNMDTTRIPLVDPHRISHVVCLHVCILNI